MSRKNAKSKAQRERRDKEGHIIEPHRQGSKRARRTGESSKNQQITGSGTNRAAQDPGERSWGKHPGGIVSKLIVSVRELLAHHQQQVGILENQLAGLEELAKDIASDTGIKEEI